MSSKTHAHGCAAYAHKSFLPELCDCGVNSAKQPKPGDVLLGCIHRPDVHGKSHVFSLPKGLEFRRPDGSSGNATWVLLCNQCFTKHADDPLKAPIGCDLTWEEGDEPIQYAEKS